MDPRGSSLNLAIVKYQLGLLNMALLEPVGDEEYDQLVKAAGWLLELATTQEVQEWVARGRGTHTRTHVR